MAVFRLTDLGSGGWPEHLHTTLCKHPNDDHRQNINRHRRQEAWHS